MILIDTHVLVWWAGGVRELSDTARKAIVDSDVIAFSSVSAWEVGTLALRGRIDLRFGTADWLRHITSTHNLKVLPVTLDIAIRASQLHETLRDPIDCLITATALAHNVPLVTKDDRIRNSGVIETIW